MANRQTAEERALETMTRRALEFRDEVARERAKLAVVDDTDAAARDVVRERLGQDAAYALYRALSTLRRLTAEYETKLRWLREKVVEQERYLGEGRLYASVPVQNADDLNHTHGQLYAAREAASSLCAAFGVYSPLSDDTDGRRTRAALLSYEVRREPNAIDSPVGDDARFAWFVVYQDGARATTVVGNEPIITFDAEWKAWRAIYTLVHGRSL